MNKYLSAVVCAWSLIAAPIAIAEGNATDGTDMQALRTAVRADKKALVASMLDLTPTEAKNFWPIYDSYQRDLDLANRRRNVVVVDVVSLKKPLTDLYAKNLVNELMAADEAE